MEWNAYATTILTLSLSIGCVAYNNKHDNLVDIVFKNFFADSKHSENSL